MRILGLIPARGGSKGVPRKNVRLLNGQPLIAHTIIPAHASMRLDHVVVSTDDEEIASVAEQFDARVVMRPAALAEDQTPMLPVALHVLDTLADEGNKYDILVLLQCTCPFRSSADIDAALALFDTEDCDAVIGVQEVGDAHPARMYRLDKRLLEPLDCKWEKANRQDLPPVYHRNGVIYAIRCEALRREQTFFAAKSRPYIMPRERSINIDEEFDFQLAEFLISRDQA